MPISSERDGRVVLVTLDNPPRNFINAGLVSELDQLFRGLERDRSVGAIILTGAHPRSFITHYEVAEIVADAGVPHDLPRWVLDSGLRIVSAMARVPGLAKLLTRTPVLRTYTAGLVSIWRLHRLYSRMNRMDKVVIAAINGNAAAGGCELALACDIRLMADGDFTIGLTEPVLGFNPGGGGGQRLARAVGTARAVEMVLEARMYSPREACQAGLVHRVVAPEELLDEARATAVRLARRSGRAIWASKRAVYKGFSSPWPRGLQLDGAGFARGAIAPTTQKAMRVMLKQIDGLPADQTPSPWAHKEMLRAWQEGTVADFSDPSAG